MLPSGADRIAADGDLHAGVFDDVCRDIAEHDAQRVMRAVGGALSRGVDPAHRLCVQAVADRPVEQVLERSRQRASVLRRAEQDRVAGGEQRAQGRDAAGSDGLFVIGIEMR